MGVGPRAGGRAGSGVARANGVGVDERLRGWVPGVFAVGDCAAFVSRRYGARLRVEHWDCALHAPEVVAANILGGDEIYDPVPYFWSEQFGRMVQYAGHHTGADRLVWRGDPAGRQWTACWLSDSGPGSGAGIGDGATAKDGAGTRGKAGPRGAERLVALLAVGRPRDLVQGRRLIAAGAIVDPARLSDPDTAVRDAVADAG